MDAYNTKLDDLQSAYKTLSTAEKEWNLNEGFTVDTLQSLVKMNPRYLKALESEGKQLKLNTDALNEVARAEANGNKLGRRKSYKPHKKVKIQQLIEKLK